MKMTRTHLYNLIACLFGGFLAGFKKARNFREIIGVIKCLGCFYGKLILEKKTTKKHEHSQVAKMQLNSHKTNTVLI